MGAGTRDSIAGYCEGFAISFAVNGIYPSNMTAYPHPVSPTSPLKITMLLTLLNNLMRTH